MKYAPCTVTATPYVHAPVQQLTGSRQYDTDDQFAATLPGDKKACLLGEALELQSRAPRPTSPRVELSASFANTSGSFNVPARVVASGSPKKDADPVPITEDTLPGAPVDPLPGAVESQSPAPEAQTAPKIDPPLVALPGFMVNKEDVSAATNIMPPSTQPPSAEALKDLQYTDDYKDSNGACPGQDGFKPPTWHSEHFKQLRKTWPTGLDADAYDIFYRDSNGLRVGTAGFKPPGDKKVCVVCRQLGSNHCDMLRANSAKNHPIALSSNMPVELLT